MHTKTPAIMIGLIVEDKSSDCCGVGEIVCVIVGGDEIEVEGNGNVSFEGLNIVDHSYTPFVILSNKISLSFSC
jgi:hypothetical protein